MLTSDQLDSLVDPILALYTEYENSIINDIARRLAKITMTDTAAWQMQRLIESGLVYENALEELSKLTGKSETELRSLFENAGVKALKFDDAIYRAAGLKPLPLNLSPAMIQVLATGLQKTRGIMQNMTMTTAISGQQIFIDAADLAYMQVSNGAMSYSQAIRDAIKSVANQGLNAINFSQRQDHLDVAMRRTVLTGVNQTVGNLQIARADELGVDLVAVSAHIGARNKGTGPMNHESWQGKVYSRSGTSRKYPDFIETTGYGTGIGLCGYNCRHSFYPFFEGISENAYPQADLNDFAGKTVKYNGEELSMYGATQEQRAIERKIRYWKRQRGALEAAGLDTIIETSKVREWQARMRGFTKQTGLSRQYDREKVIFSSSSTKINPSKETIISAEQQVHEVGTIGNPIKSIFETRTSAQTVMVSDGVLGHIEKHKVQFDIIRAKQMLPQILNDPKYLYQGKKISSIQFVEDFDDRYFLLAPVKYLPNELWLETIHIEEKKRFLKRWAKREILYERK